MKLLPLALFVFCTQMVAAPAAMGADRLTPLPSLAQADRCGPRPMKPTSCLNGSWVCRCRASGQICDWELVGCSPTDSLTPRPDSRRPRSTSPDQPVNPRTYGR